MADNSPRAPFGAIWDLDGTLVDTEKNHFEAWRRLLAEHGQGLDYEKFRPTFGRRNDDVLVDHFGFDPARISIGDLSERKEEFFRASVEADGVQFLPGALELVQHLSRMSAPQAIASSAPPGNIDLLLRVTGLAGEFAAVVSSEEVVRGKPAPDVFLKAAESLQLPPEECVVLEDAPAGVTAGKAANCRVIAIAATFSAGSLGAADVVVETFADVLWPESRWLDFLRP
jgi:beta-phosphoglucomutase